MSRSREGAWIEMPKFKHSGKTERVAPARERGLKFNLDVLLSLSRSRSREGAWIEMPTCSLPLTDGLKSLPRGSVD